MGDALERGMHPTMPPPPKETEALSRFERAVRESGEWRARLENIERAVKGGGE